MNQSKSYPPKMQDGFTLVEIMVGLVIGLLATIVIMQVFSVFEAQKRTTTGTADAQTNGNIALYDISRELLMAGYPLMPADNSPLKCTSLTVDGTADTTDRLSPVTISNNTSDSITIRYGTAPNGGIPTKITAMNAPSATDVALANNLGCTQGGRALIANGTSCFMTTASEVAAPSRVMLTDITGAAPNLDISCLGIWNEITYAVVNGDLERDGTPIVAGVVNIQAQYGISDTVASNQVTAWVDATGTWLTPSVTNRNRIKAIRIAVVSRNAKREPEIVTPNAITVWTGGPTIDLTGYTDWDHYRYRVFETIIPIRNMIWSQRILTP